MVATSEPTSPGMRHNAEKIASAASKPVNQSAESPKTQSAERSKKENVSVLQKLSSAESTAVRGKPSACVFVASLSATKNDDELCVSVTSHFRQWGELSTVKVLRDTANRPYAFVQYTNDDDCKTAIRCGHDSWLDGRNLRCEAAKVNRTLFLVCSEPIEELDVKRLLKEFGEVEQIVASDAKGVVQLKEDQVLPSSRNWYVKFVYRDDAIRAFANLSEGDKYRVAWAQNVDLPSEEELESKTTIKLKYDKLSIFVGQLNPAVKEEELTERFATHGVITDSKIIRKGNSTFAFIRFEDEAAAASAVERENHAMLKHRTMHVQYREIHPTISKTYERSMGFTSAPPPIHFNKRLVSESPKEPCVRADIKAPSFSSQKNYKAPSRTPFTKKPLAQTFVHNQNISGVANSKASQKPVAPARIKSSTYNKAFGFANKADEIFKKPAVLAHAAVNKKEFSKDEEKRSLTPPASDSTSESHKGSKSGYSPASAIYSDAPDVKTPVYPAHRERTGGHGDYTKMFGVNSSNMPYYFFVPGGEYSPEGDMHNKYVPANYYGAYPYYPAAPLPPMPHMECAPEYPPFPMYYPPPTN